MADDILDDLENDFEDDMSDILGESSLDDSDADMDALDQDLLRDDLYDEEDSKNSSPSGIKEKITGKLKSKKVLIIIGGSLFVLVSVIFAILYFIFFNSSKEESLLSEEQPLIEQSRSQEPEIVFEDIVALEPFELIRLKTSSTMGLISLNVSLELTDHRLRKQVYTMEDQLRQIVETQVAEKTWLELRNPDGKIRLKYELLKRMNSLFPKATVRNIYFTYFIMQ